MCIFVSHHHDCAELAVVIKNGTNVVTTLHLTLPTESAPMFQAGIIRVFHHPDPIVSRYSRE